MGIRHILLAIRGFFYNVQIKKHVYYTLSQHVVFVTVSEDKDDTNHDKMIAKKVYDERRETVMMHTVYLKA